MSDINGEGYGSAHNWEYIGTPYQGSSKYVCKDCKVTFWHNYNAYEDIFEAMQVSKTVTKNCPPLPQIPTP